MPGAAALASSNPSRFCRSAVAGSSPLRSTLSGLSASSRLLPYNHEMSELRAVVRNGRLVLDEPTTLPEGTVLDLVVDDEGDDLTDEERAALNAAISRAWKSLEEGRGLPADQAVARLRQRR